MIQPYEIKAPHLDPMARTALFTAANLVAAGLAEVTVSLTYSKQTETRPRLAGEDYVSLPGVSAQAQTGTLEVLRRVANKANTREGTVGDVYFRVKSMTRADGVEPFGFANIRPEGITAFVVLGVKPIMQQQQRA